MEIEKLKIPKIISPRKIQIRTISNKSPILPSINKSHTTRHINRKFISPQRNNLYLIETQVSSASRNLEIDKINLRILKERLTQRKNIFNSLEGKPEKILIKKKIIKNKLYIPIKIKKGRERELLDEKKRKEKEKEMTENEFTRITYEINDLIQDNEHLKEEIKFQRKKKIELKNLKQKIKQEIEIKEEILDEIIKKNNGMKKEVEMNTLNKEISTYKEQEKQYELMENYLEKEYNKIIQEYIKKEREKINEMHFNRQVNELKNKRSLSEFDFSENKNLEIKKELEKFESEKIQDRTPILDELIEKWRKINLENKESINKYSKNSIKIRETLNKLILQLNLDSYQDLPEFFRKTEERESNISIRLEKIQNENIELEKLKKDIISLTELIKSKKEGNLQDKNKIIKHKKEKIKIINEAISKFKKDIEIKQKFFEKIQPETDKFLKKLNNSYLSEFIHKKIELNDNKKYDCLTVNKYLSNVEDYLNIILEWKKNNNIDNIDNQNIDKLNEEFKQKLDNFEKYKLINKTLIESMQIDRKNGIQLKDIIKTTSKKLMRPINYNNNKFNKSKMTKSKYNKSKERTTENSDED